ncbi:MAG: metallophosphoesterase [Candidatus Kerfeldbacteria bacterium]|nr:metallophosphoesterase [Candidatus Kerfeldbacteria bacterium]
MKRTVIALLTIVAVTILTAAHVWLWQSIIFLFAIDSLSVKWVLGVLFGLLAIGFLPTTYLVHVKENNFTSALYLGAAVWLGSALYIAIASAIALVSVWVFDVDEYRTVIAGIFMTLGLAYAGYGVWNAQFPRLKRITLSAQKFPASWRGRTIVQLSDVHLGAVHHIRFMRRVVNEVKRAQPDLIVITGDLYDGVGRELGLMAQPLAELRPPLGMYYIIGNHETYVGLDRVFDALKDLPMRTLRDEVVEIDGVQLLGADYHLPGHQHDPRPVIDRLDHARPAIVLYHEPVPEIVEHAAEKNVTLMLCGHTHVGQLWPFSYITKKMYHRYHYGRSEVKGMTLYTSPGVGTWGPPLRTGNRPEIVTMTIE